MSGQPVKRAALLQITVPGGWSNILARTSLGLALLAFLSLASTGRAQESHPDSTTDSTPDLSGKWLYSSPNSGLPVPITIEQSGTQLEGSVEQRGECRGKSVTMRATLAGALQGRSVVLTVPSLQILQGNDAIRRMANEAYGGPCNPVILERSTFRGGLSGRPINFRQTELPSRRAGHSEIPAIEIGSATR